jgi:hypothetical protein
VGPLLDSLVFVAEHLNQTCSAILETLLQSRQINLAVSFNLQEFPVFGDLVNLESPFD